MADRIQGPAKPRTAVRFRPPPPASVLKYALEPRGARGARSSRAPIVGMAPDEPPMTDPLSSFTEQGPWEVTFEDLPWRQGLDAVRARTRAQVPDLVRRRRLPPLARLLETSVYLLAAVVGWAIRGRRRGGEASREDIARRLRQAFEHLGPTYIKLGQVISSAQGILPDELVTEFSGLRDRVVPEPFEVVQATVDEAFGRPLREVFAHFDGEPDRRGVDRPGPHGDASDG